MQRPLFCFCVLPLHLSRQIQHKRILQRHLPERTETARLPAVPSVHVGVEQERVLVGLHRAQLGHPFGRLEILHLRVVEAFGAWESLS